MSSNTANSNPKLRAYYYLTKPGIIVGNCISAAGGFLLASQGNIDWLLGLATLSGTALVIASGCVLNNYTDREIDAKMARTRKRALVRGTIAPSHALLFAAILSLAGFSILMAFTNWLTVYLGLAGLYFYVVAYGVAKRRRPIGTIVGSLAGSTPITAGYTAVTGQFDLAALLLFITMACWQMPHFYAIAMFRLEEYRKAGVPVLPAVKGKIYTKRHIMWYIVAFIVAADLLTIFGYTSYFFLGAMTLLGGAWLWQGRIGYTTASHHPGLTTTGSNTHTKPTPAPTASTKSPLDLADVVWARRMFRFSLIVMLTFSLLLGIDSFLS